MIIFGTRGVTGTRETGNFYCPRCSSQQAYARKRVRRFFTLYFIPIIPMDLLGEYIECQRCFGQYNDTVLSYNPVQETQRLHDTFLRVARDALVLMMMAEGRLDEAKVRAVQEACAKHFQMNVGEDDVRAAVSRLPEMQQWVVPTIREIAGSLNEQGKESLIRSAIAVGAADGRFSSEERELLDRLADALGMSKAHLHGILLEMNASG